MTGKKRQPTPTAAPDRKPPSAFATLHPDHTLVIGGEEVQVRAFRFREGLRLQSQIGPFITALAEKMAAADDISVDTLTEIFGQYADQTSQLLAVATGKDQDWVDALSDTDGEALLYAFWEANQDFFLRRVMTKAVTLQMAAAQAGAPLTTAKSIRH